MQDIEHVRKMVRTWLRHPQARIVAGGVALSILSCVVLVMAVNGVFRRTPTANGEAMTVPTSTGPVVPRRLDGLLVPEGEEAYPPIGIMVENHPDARPLSGIAAASVVIEAPVEGGITRLLAFYDVTTTVDQVGPVRSARPYFVDWAFGWKALYMHVGGSPDALTKIQALGDSFYDVNEFFASHSFWRNGARSAPHNVYTSHELMEGAWSSEGTSTTRVRVAWHFSPAVEAEKRGSYDKISVPYGGSYSVTWDYDKEKNVYRRSLAGRVQSDADGTPQEVENVLVMKTDQKVLDDVGRLEVRTTGSGDAFGYRDGNKVVLRWSRSPGEPIRFSEPDGSEFLFVPGKTWIEVTTDDRIFGGI